MADERLTLELVTSGADVAANRLGSLASAVEALGGGGGTLGQAGAAIGVIGRLGRFGTVLGIAAAAVAGLAGAAKKAADTLTAFGFTGRELGSSNAETALLRALGGAVGIGDVRGLASRVRSGIGSGLGAAQAARIGIGPQFDLNRGVNEGRILLKVIEDIRATRTEEEALAKARNYGAEELVRFRHISRQTFEALVRDAEEWQASFTPEAVDRAVQFNIQLDRVSRKWDQFVTSLGLTFLPIVEKVLDLLNRSGGPGVVLDQSNQKADANTKATAANTKATEALIDELRVTNGIFGGGSRARSAIPRAFGPGGGHALAGAMRAHAIRLGAYSVSL